MNYINNIMGSNHNSKISNEFSFKNIKICAQHIKEKDHIKNISNTFCTIIIFISHSNKKYIFPIFPIKFPLLNNISENNFLIV